MAANTSPIFPATPVIGAASLTAAAVVSRANVVGAAPAGLTALTPVSANGKRVDAITVKAVAGAVAFNLFVWIHDGANAMLFDELDVPAVTAGNTTDSAQVSKQYANLVLPAGYKLYVSQTVLTTANVFAFGGDY